MAEASDQILRHIEAQRSELSRHVGELETNVRQKLDWRVQVRRHPGWFIALGAVIGLLAHRMTR